MVTLAATAATCATKDLGGGFFDHGVATPVSNHRGIVATKNGQGHDVVLIWLFDHTGGYALLEVDVDTGVSRQFKMPFPPRGDCPYASLLSSRNRFYTHFASHFVEFDPQKEAFTFWQETKPQMAMGMTEDDQGRVWSVTYPNSGVVCFDPATRTLTDYGWVHQENWRQYQRSVAADDAGWIYFGIGNTASQIVMFDPVTRKATAVLPERERVRGSATVIRDVNGKVYGRNGGDVWYELYRGEARRLPHDPAVQVKRVITGSQGLVYRTFPDGRKLKVCDTVEHYLTVVDPRKKTTKRIEFEYTSEGAYIMDVAVAPNGTLCGGTAFPMRFFSYDPKKDSWINRAAYGQWNTITRQGDRFFVGGYTHGFLLEWDPAKPWVPTVPVGHGKETIGWGYSQPDYYHFHGLLDEVRIYGRALTLEELDQGGAEGAAAAWSFEEGQGTVAVDSSGQGNNATIHGAEWVEGKVGKALKFDGNAAFLEVPDAPSLHPEKALTVEAWVYPTPPHQHGYGGLLNNIAGHGNSRLLIMDNGQTLAQVAIGGTAQNVLGPLVKNNAWNHVAYVFDGTYEYWVVNGQVGKKYPRSGALTVQSNPRFLTQCHPDINRPHDLLAYPDGNTVVLAGTPGYGYTGGGLLFWDRRTQTRVLRTHEELLPEQATMSLAPLPAGRILGGSTTAPGTGGEKKAKEAELYILDLTTKNIEWHAVLFPGAQSYTDLGPGPRGLIYGVVEQQLFFVFDPRKRKVIHTLSLSENMAPTLSSQGPRVFVRTTQGDTFMLLAHGIARIDPDTFAVKLVAKSPTPLTAGGDYLDDRLYFASGSHLVSWKVSGPNQGP